MRARSLIFASPVLFAFACSSGGDASTSSTSSSSSSGSGGSTTASSSSSSSGGGASSSSSSGAGGQGGGLCGGAQKAHEASKVLRYEYTFDLASSKGTSRLTYDAGMPAVTDGATADFSLAQLANAQWNDKPAKGAAVASGKVDVTGLEACTQNVTMGGDVLVPKKSFLGLDVGFDTKPDLAGGSFDYLLSWVGGCSHFGPCDADPGTLAEFAFDIKHAATDVVLCPGARTASATETKCEVKGTLAPTYSAFALAADAKWKESELVQDGALDVKMFEVPGGPIQAAVDTSSFKDYLDWIQKLLGPFPYGAELRFAGGPTEWLGFEHPANIVLHEQLPSQTGAYLNPTMHVMMHETAHQWSGDRATIKTPLDFVWKEATVEYLTYVFEDEHRPAGEAAASLAYWDNVSLFSAHYPRPTDNPAPAVQDFYGDVYGPGPMVLYVQLETMLGRPAVLEGIQAFLAKPGAYAVDDLRAALEKASGQALKPYFDAWVFGQGAPEWPTFDVSSMPGNASITVTLTQKNASGKLYGCKVGVQLVGTTGATAMGYVDFGLDPKQAAAQVVIPFTDGLKSIVVDPEHRVVERDMAAPYKIGPKPRVYIL